MLKSTFKIVHSNFDAERINHIFVLIRLFLLTLSRYKRYGHHIHESKSRLRFNFWLGVLLLVGHGEDLCGYN